MGLEEIPFDVELCVGEGTTLEGAMLDGEEVNESELELEGPVQSKQLRSYATKFETSSA